VETIFFIILYGRSHITLFSLKKRIVPCIVSCGINSLSLVGLTLNS